jgi:hypothetical protein
MWLITASIGSQWAGSFRRRAAPTQLQVEAYGNLRRRVVHWLGQAGNSVPVRNWDTYLSTMEITYSGEVSAKAVPLEWAKMSVGLPPPQHCASVNVESLCEGPMLDFVRDPWLSYRGGLESGPRPRPGRFNCRPGQEVVIVKNLFELGLVRPIDEDELIWFKDGPLCNGWFAVGKNGGVEVLRWIQNLTATNEVQHKIDGDMDKLPYFGQWKSLILPAGAVARWSWSDIVGCFYIFRLYLRPGDRSLC